MTKYIKLVVDPGKGPAPPPPLPRLFLDQTETLSEGLDLPLQAWDAVFHHQMKHGEESWKYVGNGVFFTNFFSWLNTVSNAWYNFSKKFILEGEIKNAKMSSFSSDFQTLIKHDNDVRIIETS